MNRCTRGNPCPVCGRTSWCCTDNDGGVYCMREHKILEGGGSFPPSGWKVLKRNNDGGAYLKPEHLVEDNEGNVRPYKPRPKPKPAPKPLVDWTAIQDQFVVEADELAIVNLAKDLGVTVRSLALMGIGWCRAKEAWSFPMRDGSRAICGMRLRKDGSKFAIKGSSAGVFLPDLSMESWEDEERIYVCEGPTDTAAVLTMGAYAIGRPSAGGGSDIICKLAAGKKVVIVADNDAAGARGAQTLCSALKQVGSRVKIVKPPAKDVRAWLNDGATLNDLEELVDNTKERRDAKQVQGEPT